MDFVFFYLLDFYFYLLCNFRGEFFLGFCFGSQCIFAKSVSGIWKSTRGLCNWVHLYIFDKELESNRLDWNFR